MNLKKIFKVLVTAVVAVILGAFLLNIILPNATKTLINATEDLIYKATSLSFDFNNDGISGSNKSTYKGDQGDGTGNGGQSTVEGFN